MITSCINGLTYDAVAAVPNNEPVMPLMTFNELRVASLPDVMTFFQDGIL
jgi:hypothetical protein